MERLAISYIFRLQRVPSLIGVEAAYTIRDIRKKYARQHEEDWEKQQKHPAGDDTAETICAGSRDPSIMDSATTADLPTGECHG